jgi:hypothetical protein
MDLRSTYRREIVLRGEPRKAIVRSACHALAMCLVFLAGVYGARWWGGRQPVFSVGPIGGAIAILLGWAARIYRTVEAGYREFESTVKQEPEPEDGRGR